MNNRRVTPWRSWPKSLRVSSGAFVGVLAAAALYAGLAGIPGSVAPAAALFDSVKTDQVLAESRPELSSFDFIFRPVFSTKRRPPAAPVISDSSEADGAKSGAEELAVRSMEGSHLLGIFGSGEVEGAIVRLDNGERHRLVIGDRLEGWTLQSVSSREIRFVSESGEVADLDMLLSRAQQPLAIQAAPSAGSAAGKSIQGDSSDDGGSREAASDNTAEATSFTFDSIYRARYDKEPTEGQEASAEGQEASNEQARRRARGKK